MELLRRKGFQHLLSYFHIGICTMTLFYRCNGIYFIFTSGSQCGYLSQKDRDRLNDS